MASRGYGSEAHLRQYLQDHRAVLDECVADAVGVMPTDVTWLDFIPTVQGDREYRGIEFLDRGEHAATWEAWRQLWPTTGRQPSWDAIAKAGAEWVLVEAKANHPEFCTPGSTSSPESRKRIVRALNATKKRLGVHRHFAWDASYYQYANRLVLLEFLREHNVPTRLLFVYFTGDCFPDDTPCPATHEEWEQLFEARRLTLGLPSKHALSSFVHHAFLPVI